MHRHHGPEPDPLKIHVAEDGRVLVHVGTRFVETSPHELDRLLERLGADGGAVVYSRDDPADVPGPVALEVAELIASHGVELRLRDDLSEISDADL